MTLVNTWLPLGLSHRSSINGSSALRILAFVPAPAEMNMSCTMRQPCTSNASSLIMGRTAMITFSRSSTELVLTFSWMLLIFSGVRRTSGKLHMSSSPSVAPECGGVAPKLFRCRPPPRRRPARRLGAATVGLVGPGAVRVDVGSSAAARSCECPLSPDGNHMGMTIGVNCPHGAAAPTHGNIKAPSAP